MSSPTDEFGPEVLFTALMDEGVQFVFVGFITHYAAQRYERRHRTGGLGSPRTLAHGESLERLARALRSVDATVRGRSGEPTPFAGCGADLAGINEVFETPYGTVSIVTDASEYDVGSPEGTRIRIAIGCPTEYLRACAASGRFDDELNRLLEIVELFEQLG
ncbi:hypothetical protein [Nocardia otitidiscaviarum]|uniref:hypothetical protein n=1 Tax=Nocardia otitidiscaviarum TaxID=1823 RepID=UPI00245631BC|nr:hypothetical protein [Nocardia otitidiscaviarum]